ncbi:MAG: hypothetical protein L6R42_004688 [Xanthoria sp. 1 TBL-2021]|nr:MAG: hypothetical protein L6R42_004688 [Xanthoria sp. 1 TBL-2021]
MDPSEVAVFSNRGPTKEGRIKPDVMAPGTAILSTASRDLDSRSDRRVEYGICLDDDWMFMSGTSMSTPLVAGCIASLRQAVRIKGVQAPSAALIKALLINGTIDIQESADKGKSTSSTPAAPNGLQGFGRVQMSQSMAALSTNPGCRFVDAGDGKVVPPLTPQDRWWESGPIEILKSDSSLVATLAYCDREGQLLQNDLNLIIRNAYGEERHGNCSTGSQFDGQNNVEKIVWMGIGPGSAYLRTEAVGGFTRFNDPQGFAAVWAVM